VQKSYERDQPVAAGDLQEPDVKTQEEMMSHDDDEKDNAPGRAEASRWSDQQAIRDSDPQYDEILSCWEPKPPKVLMNDPNDSPLELRSQIQLYATNE
jgi:hypothetical protein